MTALRPAGPTVWRDDKLEASWFEITRRGAWIQIGMFRRYGVTWC